MIPGNAEFPHQNPREKKVKKVQTVCCVVNSEQWIHQEEYMFLPTDMLAEVFLFNICETGAGVGVSYAYLRNERVIKSPVTHYCIC